MVGGDQTHERHGQAPAETQDRDPDGRTQQLQDDVGRNLFFFFRTHRQEHVERTGSRENVAGSQTYLEQGVGDEKHRQSRVVSHAVELQVLVHACDPRIADIASVDIRKTTLVSSGNDHPDG